MTHPLENILNHKVILGSASPRRKELLESLDVPFQIITSSKDEIFPEDLPANEVPSFLSKLKYDDIIATNALPNNYLIITADTIVIQNGQILGKPLDLGDAQKMLKQLSGVSHRVITGVTIGSKDEQVHLSDTTEVTLAKLSSKEIEWYSTNYQVLDKAGAYGIQDWLGTAKVTNLKGSYHNVMGLPTHRLFKVLSDWPR